jgi:hypothetical protein
MANFERVCEENKFEIRMEGLEKTQVSGWLAPRLPVLIGVF